MILERIDKMPSLIFACAALAAAVGVRYFCFKNNNRKFVLILCAFFMVGLLSTAFTLFARMNVLCPLSGNNVTATVRITEVSDIENEYYDKYIVTVSELEYGKENARIENVGEKLVLSVKKYNQKRACPTYKYGDVVKVKARLSEQDKPMNWGDADYSYANKANGIFFILTGEYDESKYLYSQISRTNIYDISNSVREYFEKVIDGCFTGDDASFLKGILISKKTFSEEYRRRLSDSGMTHITVASGLHVGCVSVAVLWICFALRMKKRLSYAVCSVLLWMFAFLHGMTPSIVRAVIMMCFYMLAQLVGRDYDRENILYITAFIMLFVNPYMVFDVAFILSFASVLGIVLFVNAIDSYVVRIVKFKKLSSIISATFAVQITVFPLLALYFNKISMYCVIANMLAVPVLAPVLVLGFLLLPASVLWTGILYCVAFALRIFVKYINVVIYAVSSLPYAGVDIFFVNIAAMCIYYLLVLALHMWFTKGSRRYNFAPLGICGVITACTLMFALYTNSYMHVTFINVGQGDAAMIKIPYGKTVVIDGGGSSPMSKSDVGEKIFVPYLRRSGVNTVDYAVLSHYDKDHAQGIAALLRHMRVKNLVVPYRENMKNNEYKNEIERLAVDKSVNVMYFKEGDSLEIGGVALEAFAPTQRNAANRAMDENQKSLIVKLTYGETSFLFTGDVGLEAESKAAKYGEKISCDVLKVAHHGSVTSSSTKFIRTVSPEYAVISVGKDNMYGLPARETLITLARENTDIYRTDECGTIDFCVGRSGIKTIDTFYERPSEEQTFLERRAHTWQKNLHQAD